MKRCNSTQAGMGRRPAPVPAFFRARRLVGEAASPRLVGAPRWLAMPSARPYVWIRLISQNNRNFFKKFLITSFTMRAYPVYVVWCMIKAGNMFLKILRYSGISYIHTSTKTSRGALSPGAWRASTQSIPAPHSRLPEKNSQILQNAFQKHSQE